MLAVSLPVFSPFEASPQAATTMGPQSSATSAVQGIAFFKRVIVLPLPSCVFSRVVEVQTRPVHCFSGVDGVLKIPKTTGFFEDVGTYQRKLISSSQSIRGNWIKKTPFPSGKGAVIQRIEAV
jgi:hypothetical protein